MKADLEKAENDMLIQLTRKTKQDFKELQLIFKQKSKLFQLLSKNLKIKKLLLPKKSKSNKFRILLQKQPQKPPICNQNKLKKLLPFRKHQLIQLIIKPKLSLQNNMLKSQLTRNMTSKSVLFRKEIIRQPQLLERKHSNNFKLQSTLKLTLKERQDLKKKENISKNM